MEANDLKCNACGMSFDSQEELEKHNQDIHPHEEHDHHDHEEE